MTLHLLPDRLGGAAENMALDFLLLRRYPEPDAPRFRHYGWRGPAFTFGYSQKIAAVRGMLPADGPFDLCRRPTGGGLVDHRDDWTYALVLPRGHPLEDVRAAHSYREVHACLAAALAVQGVRAGTQPPGGDAADGPEAPAGVCFSRAEVHDVIRLETGEKIAGAAQKRARNGLLFQGSIARSAAGAAVNWDTFRDDFTARLAVLLAAPNRPTAWPDFTEGEAEALTEQYASPEWLELR